MHVELNKNQIDIIQNLILEKVDKINCVKNYDEYQALKPYKRQLQSIYDIVKSWQGIDE